MDHLRRDSSRESIQSLERAASICEVLAAARTGQQLAEISRRTNLNRSTAYRLLRSLEQNQLVVRDDEGRYRLSFLIRHFGEVAREQSLPCYFEAAEYMHDCAERLHVTAFLAVAEGRDAIYIAQAVYGDPHYIAYPAGSSLPLHLGAGGKVLLAHAPATEIDDYLSRPLEQLIAGAETNPAALRTALVGIKQSGLATTEGDNALGIGACGAPIFSKDGAVIAAVSFSAPVSRVHEAGESSLSHAVKMLARQISEMIQSSH